MPLRDRFYIAVIALFLSVSLVTFLKRELLMDMRMPVMNSYDAIQQIKSDDFSKTKIIALTASAMEEEREVILATGCNDFLSKPFQADELFSLMTKHLGVCYTYAEVANPTEPIALVSQLDNNSFATLSIVKNYDNVPTIACYPEELQKIWLNLIQNAVDAMGEQGILTLNVYRQLDNLAVDIMDTGLGVAPEIVNNICDPFFSTKSSVDHTGLGLSIAKQIIEKHDGTITVKSMPGKTIFTVYLLLNELT